MSKEKQKREYESKQLIEELSKMPPMVIATAYLHAINYVLYGEDVTEKWVTATQNASALEKAYRKGYMDGVNDQEESLRARDTELLDKVAEKIREYSGLHYVDCDGYFGGITELIFKVDDYLDDIIAELKAEVENDNQNRQ